MVLAKVGRDERGAGCEEEVDFFEGLTVWFGEEKVHQWYRDYVEAGVDEEGRPSHIRQHDGNHQTRGTTADSPSEDREAVALGSDLLWPNLRGVHPRGYDKEHAEEEEEAKHHRSSCLTIGCSMLRLELGESGKCGGQEERNALYNKSDHQAADTSNPVNHEGLARSAINVRADSKNGKMLTAANVPKIPNVLHSPDSQAALFESKLA